MAYTDILKGASNIASATTQNTLGFDENIDVGNSARSSKNPLSSLAQELYKLGKVSEKAYESEQSAKEKSTKDRNIEETAKFIESNSDNDSEAQQLLDKQDNMLNDSTKNSKFIQDEEIGEPADDEIEAWAEESINNWYAELYMKSLVLADMICDLARAKCPKDTEALANSGKVIQSYNGYAVVFGMGMRQNKKSTDKIDYATFVHEIGYYRHMNGQAKYLEDAAIEIINSYRDSEELYFKIDYDVSLYGFKGCMVLYISYDGETPGMDLDIVQRGTSQLQEGFMAWTLGVDISDEDTRKRSGLRELFDSTYVMVKGELLDLREAKTRQDLLKIDAIARAHISDFTKRGSFLKTFYHLYGRR